MKINLHMYMAALVICVPYLYLSLKTKFQANSFKSYGLKAIYKLKMPIKKDI